MALFYVLLDYIWHRMLSRSVLPLSWRQPLSFGLLIIILATLVFERARRFGLIISHIYAVVIGLLSYATFTTYLQNLGPDIFYKNIALAILHL